ncbi:MAG: lipoyl(octanoyl) transferase LipB [Bacteroidales bacterium]|nr:lipoyl(octanoyl) transferase LipB [Bacteroidales bacterium]
MKGRPQKVIITDLGLIDFKEAWEIQRKAASGLIQKKNESAGTGDSGVHRLFLCEHPHVYTLGKSGSESNLLVNEQMLEQKGANVIRIDRGGDITYHGPGQLVCYPVFDLAGLGIGVKQYIELLEEAVIMTIGHYGISGQRMEGATGVWLEPDLPGRARKICAIGVKVSRAVTNHGLALNVNTDLDYFRYINPCGFTDKGVTSIKKELGRSTEIKRTKELVREAFLSVFYLLENGV